MTAKIEVFGLMGTGRVLLIGMAENFEDAKNEARNYQQAHPEHELTQFWMFLTRLALSAFLDPNGLGKKN
jgi:hypothetical protein